MRRSRAPVVGLILVALAGVATPAPDVVAELDMRMLRACHDALLNQQAHEVNEAGPAASSCPAELLAASAYFKAIRDLAVRGDIPAQRCLIQGYFASAAQEDEESRMRKDEVDEYLRLARKYIDEAFERGDWSVVRWLARSRIGLQDSMLRTAYPFGYEHPETVYRMNYLLMLGEKQNFETTVNPRQVIEDSKKYQTLTSKKFQEAEAWAHNRFDRRFRDSQEGAVTTQFCEHP